MVSGGISEGCREHRRKCYQKVTRQRQNSTMYTNLWPPPTTQNFYTWCHFPFDASLFDSIFGDAPHTPPTPHPTLHHTLHHTLPPTPMTPSPPAYTKLNLNSGSAGPGCWSGCWSWLLVLAAGLAGLVLAAGLAAGLALALALAAGPGCWSGWLLVASC